ncbi:MAG: tripartite tricarboxylate transporter substrate binding protein [Betaproteobacteria bacterium]|nr:tripartite tricarboxylate transporter substrate binding protein [Betaproteobacteria bacterium]MBI2960421.1 tripartite tricarboxylate transporter substrate binding protein [Betaproteobacteria bacterium]
MKRLSRIVPISLIVALAAGNVLAQSYPSRPVRVVIPMAAGGQMDTIARLIAQKLTESWKQPALIENRGGSGGNVGATAVAKSEPNGYTFLMASSGIAISRSVYRKLAFDPVKDLIPVSQIYSSCLMLVVNPSVPANSVTELIALAKAQPGRLNYASSGSGGNPHLAAELFKAMTGTDMVHIPYKGAAQTDSAVVANEVQVLFAIQDGVLPFVKSGRLRALGITAKSRLSAMPDVPTVAESGVPDYEFRTWVGMFAPAGTAREIVTRLYAEVARILAMPDVRERIIGMRNEPAGTTPEEFDAMFKADVARYARIVKEARIPLQD